VQLESVPSQEATQTADTVTIGRVELDVDEETGYSAGGESDYAVSGSCSFASQALCEEVLDILDGVRYTGVQVPGAICDPRLELGDAVYASGYVFRVMSMDADFGADCTATLEAPIETEVEHEIPYQDKGIKAVSRKIAQAKAEIKVTTDSITASVADTDGRVSTLAQTVEGVSSAVAGLSGDSSSLKQTVSSLQGQVESAAGDISTLQQTATSLQGQITSAAGDISTLQQTASNISASVQRRRGPDQPELQKAHHRIRAV
jgi:hypothetical protein